MDSPKVRLIFTTQYLKSLVGPVGESKRDADWWGPPLDQEESALMATIVRTDYLRWAAALNLSPVPVDVFGWVQEAEGRTELGSPRSNATPLYDTQKIVIPLIPSQTREDGMIQPEFPPSAWDGKPPVWPRWRLDLLHEVVHQVENDRLQLWTGREDVGTYRLALASVSDLLQAVAPATLDELVNLTIPGVVNNA